MNKHILIAMDKESFTKDELKKNKESADADYTAAVAYAYTATAAAAATYDDAVDYWIDMYFKETGENKQDYIDEIKRLKGSVVMDIWKDAPESATHYDIEAECFCKNDGYWATGSRARYVQDSTQIQWGDEDRYTPRPMLIDCKVNNEPQPTLTYTQAMADNTDFLPPVNMIVKHRGVKKIVIGELDYNNNLALKSIDNELYSVGHIYDIEPLTPPIEPEEKALNDMMEQLKNEGICSYDPIMLRILIAKFKANKIHGVSFQPLTVEVK